MSSLEKSSHSPSIQQTDILPIQNQDGAEKSKKVSSLGRFFSKGLTQFTKKIDAFVTSLAFGDQFKQLKQQKKYLNSMLKANPSSKDSLIKEYHLKNVDEKKTSLKKRIGTLSTKEKATIAFEKTMDKIAFLRTAIMRHMIHPASKYSNPQTVHKENFLHEIDRKLLKAGGERVQFFTEDHQLIDGAVIYAKPDQKEIQRPTLVMCPGNTEAYEDFLEIAMKHSKKFNVNVVLYNPRGVGNSLGSSRSTDDSVLDAKAAIEYALNNLCKDSKGHIDSSNLAVYGFSLGGGLSAEALKALIKEEKIEQIGLYTNIHSFRSLDKFVGGLARDKTPAISTFTKYLLKMFSLNNLDTEKTLKENKLANRVQIVTSTDDQFMVGQGRLGGNSSKEPLPFKPAVEDISRVFENRHHNDNENYIYNDEYVASMRAWVNSKNPLRKT